MSNNHGDIVIAAPAGYKWDEGTLKKITYVAEAGGVKYESLQKAIDAAKSKMRSSRCLLIPAKTSPSAKPSRST